MGQALPTFDQWMHDHPDRPDRRETPRPSPTSGAVGAAFSGGGYKATMFHLGSLIRLNELGALPRIKTFSSVSGGTITIAWLGGRWSELDFDEEGVARNFDRVIAEPLIDFVARRKLDVNNILAGGLLPGVTAAQKIARGYDKYLFRGKTLQDLPNGPGSPQFIINATNLQLNVSWRFSRKAMGDYKVGFINNPTLSLATATAASSAFPPFLSPLKLDFDPDAFFHSGQPVAQAREDMRRRVYLGDGGIYDNMGLEAVQKDHGTILVSNAGDPFKIDPKPKTDWYSQFRRAVAQIHRHAENNRLRWLIDRAKDGDVRVAAWRMSQRVGAVDPRPAAALDNRDAWQAAVQKVGLSPLPADQINRLINHGYELANLMTAIYWTQALPPGEGPSMTLPR